MASRKPVAAELIAGVVLALFLACASTPEVQKQRFLALGDDYLQRKQFEEASILYRNALAMDRRFALAYYRLGLANQGLGNRGGAARAFLRAFELDPDNLDAFRQLAELHFVSLASPMPVNRQATLDSLIRLHAQAEQRHPDSLEVLLLKGQILAYQGAAEEALSLFRRTYDRSPDNPSAALGLAASLVQTGLMDEARGVAEKHLAHDPTSEPLYDFIYLLYARNGDREGAKEVLRRKCENIPANTGDWMALAFHYRAMGKNTEAEAIIERLLGDRERYPDARRLAGDYYLRLGEAETALQLYRLGMEEDAGKEEMYRYGIVNAHLGEGDFAAAAVEIDRILNADPNDAAAVGLRGLLRLHGGKPEELTGAVEDLRTALGGQPENHRLRYYYGQALFASGDSANAELEFKEALRTNEDFLPAKHALVDLLLSRSEFVPAERVAREILAQAPFDAMARLTAAEAHFGLRQYEQARQELEGLTHFGPSARRAKLLIARIDLAEGKTAEAERGLRALVDADPPDTEALRELMEWELERGRPESALAVVNEALEREPSNVNLRVAAGRLAMVLNREDEAAALLEAVMRDHPRHGPANAYLGELEERRGNRQSANKHLRRAMAAQPPVPFAFLAFGAALAAERKYEEARPYLERAVQLAPESAAARNNLASVLAELGEDLDAALNHAQRAVAQDPDNTDFADTLGYVYLKRRLYANAVEVLEKIVQRRPDRDDYRYHLGLALYESGEPARALPHLSKAKAGGERLNEAQRFHVRRLLSEIERSTANSPPSSPTGG